MKTLLHAIRSLKHFRLYSVINLLGLAMTLACVVVIVHYVYAEITVDHFHTKHKQTFIVTVEPEERLGRFFPATNRDLPDVVKNDPAIERMDTFCLVSNGWIEVDGQHYGTSMLITDTVFLQIMDYPILRGENNIWRPESALISESLAKRIFGHEDPLGKTFKISYGHLYTIVGILERLPGKSGFDFELILSSNNFPQGFLGLRGFPIVELSPNQDYRKFNEKYSTPILRSLKSSTKYRYSLFPLDQLYYRTQFTDTETYEYKTGNKTGIAILSLVCFMILIVGLTNFINVQMAVVLHRGREFGMKKVFGASGKNIFLQLWAENMVMVGLALMVAFLLIGVFNPLIKNVLQLNRIPFQSFDMLLVLGLCGVVPLFVSVFPFLRYSYRKPVTSLQSVGKTGGKSGIRRLFLGFQYIITIVMVILSLLFMKQFRFMTQKDLGFRTKDIIQVSLMLDPLSRYAVGPLLDNMKDQLFRKLSESPLFTHGTRWSNPVKSLDLRVTDIHLPGEETPEGIRMMAADREWLDIFELKLIAGSFWEKQERHSTFSREGSIWGKTTQEMGLIFTKSALKAFGLDLSNYADVILENNDIITDITYDRASPFVYGNLRIQGVVEDIYKEHLSKDQYPIIFYPVKPSEYIASEGVIVSIVPGRRQEALNYLHQAYSEIVGGYFGCTFFEDEVRAMYSDDRKIATVYFIFTTIAILISIMGLFGLSLFDIRQRRREIAIRKINGATTGVVILMFLKRYVKLLLVAFAIAVPIGWLAVQRYLEGFALKTAVSWWIFAVALFVTVIISLLTLVWQTQKAASANPAIVIRNE